VFESRNFELRDKVEGLLQCRNGFIPTPSVLFAGGHHALQFIVEPLRPVGVQGSRFSKEVIFLQFWLGGILLAIY